MLDQSVSSPDGKPVPVVVARMDEPVLSGEQNLEAWRAWVASGEQGPIEDESEPASRDAAQEAVLDELAAEAQKHRLGY